MPTTGSMIDRLHTLREERRLLEKKIEDINKDFSIIEGELMKQMRTEGLESAKGKFASASVTEVVKPSVEDWDKFYAYIKRHDYFHLLERRPSVTGCRELFETKGKIPGVLPITLPKISLRNT
jgi:hypothetical protein